jgi:hypothetical protein
VVFDKVLRRWREHGFGWRSAARAARVARLRDTQPRRARHRGVAAEEVEIGWATIRRARGRGYASEAALAVRDRAFERLGLARIVARLQPANLASERVARKIGMHLERETTGRHGESLHIYALDRRQSRPIELAISRPRWNTASTFLAKRPGSDLNRGCRGGPPVTS